MKAIRFALEVLRTATTDLARRPIASLLSLLAMVIAVCLLTSFLLLSQGVRRVVAEWIDQAVVDVYLRPGATREEVRDLRAELARDPAVRRVDWIPPETALAQFRELFPDLADVDRLLGENPFPASLRVVPVVADETALERALAPAHEHAAVTGVRYDRDWLAAVARAASGLSWFVLGGAGLLLAGALMTIGSVVRLALDDKRDEVALMRLIGAPMLFVVSPVLVAGAILGGIGSALAVLLVDAGRSLLVSATAAGPLAGWVAALFGSGLPPAASVVVVLGGALSGCVAAGLAAGPAAFE